MPNIADILAFLDQEHFEYAFLGDANASVNRFSSLSNYVPGTFTWVSKPENIPEGMDLSQITLVFLAEEVDPAPFRNSIRTSHSKRAFFDTIAHFYTPQEERPAIGQFTYISPKVKLGKNVRIGHNCTLDGEITIGDNTIIWNNVTIINRVTIGHDSEIGSGTVIGHDGFGFTEEADHTKEMVRHFGGVSIGNHVTILEHCSISRGAIDDTTIADGVKIDASVRVGHNCILEENSAFVGGSILYGSTHFGRNSYIATAIVKNQVHVGENGFAGVGAVVLKDIAPDQVVVGNPAKPLVKKS